MIGVRVGVEVSGRVGFWGFGDRAEGEGEGGWWVRGSWRRKGELSMTSSHSPIREEKRS